MLFFNPSSVTHVIIAMPLPSYLVASFPIVHIRDSPSRIAESLLSPGKDGTVYADPLAGKWTIVAVPSPYFC